ncbi:MAG: ABC transporter ATP-binding protein [Verrucomicrobia bacterium]|nr:ABC transporter ATP-binding protein [Verrucomicrobiota bacterium]
MQSRLSPSYQSVFTGVHPWLLFLLFVLPDPAANLMSNVPIIFAEGLTKAYRIWKNPSDRLKSPIVEGTASLFPRSSAAHRTLASRAARGYRDFYALRDVALNIKRGEAIGIIGRNGSGKSTLLQMIAGTLTPTTGKLSVHGRVSALLELGSGFNPEFTGRENVFINGSILGLSRAQMTERFEAIADFAEIGDFIDQPVKIYSSGMLMRLAFAVAAHVDPDILIVDEALSVGDARFQLKCARAIDRFIAQGVTLLFVSHDASLVKRLCHHAILLEHGQVIYAGKPNDVVNLYSKLLINGNTAESLQTDIEALKTKTISPERIEETTKSDKTSAAVPQLPPLTPVKTAPSDTRTNALLTDERDHVQVSGQEFTYGGELGLIHSVTALDESEAPRTWFSSGEQITVRMVVEAREDLHEPIFALTLKNNAGVEIYGTNTLFSQQPAPAMKSGETREVDFIFPLDLMPGHYFLSFGFTHFVGDKLVVLQRRYDAIKIDVHAVDRTFGIANLRAAIVSRPIS